MKYLAYLLIPIVVGIVIQHLNKDAPSVTIEGFNLLQIKKGYGKMGWFGLAFFGVIYMIFVFDVFYDFSWTENPTTVGDLLIPNIIFLILIFMAVLLTSGVNNYKILFNDVQIVFCGVFGKLIEINWSDISKVTFSKIGPRLQIYTKTCSIYVLSEGVSGFRNFVSKLESTIGHELTKTALSDLKKYEVGKN